MLIIKTYYQRLSKEEKKEIKNIYQKEYQNTELNKRLKRINVLIILSIISAIFLLVMSYIYEDKHWSSYIIAGVLLATALTFFIASTKIKNNVYNKIALKNKKATK